MCLESTWTELIKKITALFLLSRVTVASEQSGADIYKVESFHGGRQGRQLGKTGEAAGAGSLWALEDE